MLAQDHGRLTPSRASPSPTLSGNFSPPPRGLWEILPFLAHCVLSLSPCRVTRGVGARCASFPGTDGQDRGRGGHSCRPVGEPSGSRCESATASSQPSGSVDTARFLHVRAVVSSQTAWYQHTLHGRGSSTGRPNSARGRGGGGGGPGRAALQCGALGSLLQETQLASAGSWPDPQTPQSVSLLLCRWGSTFLADLIGFVNKNYWSFYCFGLGRLNGQPSTPCVCECRPSTPSDHLPDQWKACQITEEEKRAQTMEECL